MNIYEENYFKSFLKYPQYWSEINDDESNEYTYIYDYNNRYALKIFDDESSRIDISAFSYSQFQKRINWKQIKFQIDGKTVNSKEYSINSLNGSSFYISSPTREYFDEYKSLYYYYFIDGEIDTLLNKFLLQCNRIKYNENPAIIDNLKKDIVRYSNDNERLKVKSIIDNNLHSVLLNIEPSQADISSLTHDTSVYINRDLAYNIIRAHNLAKYINNVIKKKLF